MLILLSIQNPVKAFIKWKILVISFNFDISIKKALARFGEKKIIFKEL